MSALPSEGPFVFALLAISLAALAFSWRSFQLLYREFRPRYTGRHRGRRARRRTARRSG